MPQHSTVEHVHPTRSRSAHLSRRGATALFVLFTAPHLCYAQSPVGFRSGFTEGNGIAPRGHVDVDYGSSISDAGSTRNYTVGEVVAHVPVSPRFGVRLHLNSYAWVQTPTTRTTGHEDFGFGTSFIVRQNAGWRPSLAVLTRLDTPSGTLPSQGSSWRPTVKAALSCRLPAGLTGASNVGITSVATGDNRFMQHFGSLWLGRHLAGPVGAFTEAFAFDRESVGGPGTSYLRAGVEVLVTHHNIHLDVNAATQLHGAVTRRTLGIGVKQRL